MEAAGVGAGADAAKQGGAAGAGAGAHDEQTERERRAAQKGRQLSVDDASLSPTLILPVKA